MIVETGGRMSSFSFALKYELSFESISTVALCKNNNNERFLDYTTTRIKSLTIPISGNTVNTNSFKF